MDIKISYSQNTIDDKYKSKKYMVELTQQLPDGANIPQATTALFATAKSSVLSEIELAMLPKIQQNNFNNNGNHNGPKLMSDKQKSYLFQLSRKAGLTNEQVNSMPSQYFQKQSLDDLTSKEASRLIEIMSGTKSQAA